MSIKKPKAKLIAMKTLERRERIATACLAGLLANSEGDIEATSDQGIASIAAESAVHYADALIAALDEPAPKARLAITEGEVKAAAVAVPRKKKR
jgi:hypothetical protein